MLYKSTRSQAVASHSAAQIIKQGLAEDGGLFVPETFPKITTEDFEKAQSQFTGIYRHVLTLTKRDWDEKKQNPGQTVA